MPPGSSQDPRPLSVAIVGADAQRAVHPATPVQLAHACHALGYDVVVPASWGDELVAQGCLERLAARRSGDEGAREPVILCSCPHVTERLTRTGADLAPWMMTLIAPPVAAARYLRAVYDARRAVHITYLGACPAAVDPAIDARLTPNELLAALHERGIVLAEQPEVFESVLPPDRRRFYSMPGGAPSAERLAEVDAERVLVELGGENVVLELAQRLLSRQRALIDLAPGLGCACGAGEVGAAPASPPHEPPRAPGAVLDPAVRVELAVEATSTPPSPHPQPIQGSPPPSPAAAHRRPSAVPALRRRDGTTIPRAYAAHRRRAQVLPALHPAALALRQAGSGRGRTGPSRPTPGRSEAGASPREAQVPLRAPLRAVLPPPHEPHGPPRPVPPPPARRMPSMLPVPGALA